MNNSPRIRLSLIAALCLGAGIYGCSSSGTTTPDSGGGTGGGAAGSGGSGSGGSGSGGSGTGGSSGGAGGSQTGGSGGGSGGSSGSGGSGSGGSGGGSGGASGGSDGGAGTGGSAGDAATELAADRPADATTGAFMFSSSGLRMMGAGLVFPAAHSAPLSATTNLSPPFVWSGAPAGTMSFAITLTDLTANNTSHWVIHDIPATVMMLPQGLPRMRTLTTPVMAKQKAIYGDTNGYEGPGGGGTNMYEFELWALNVATLPANVAAMNPTQMRTSATGLTMYKVSPTSSVKIMARGTRGGL